jgi:hypothetical protein
MPAIQFIADPLNGKVTLWRVVWLYSFVGGAVIQIAAFLLVEAGVPIRVVALVCLAYGAFVTFAVYRCARNCPWPTFGRLVRFCALLSLLLAPIAAYLIASGSVTLKT